MAYFLISLDVNITVTVMPPIRTSGQPQSVGQDPHTEGAQNTSAATAAAEKR